MKTLLFSLMTLIFVSAQTFAHAQTLDNYRLTLPQKTNILIFSVSGSLISQNFGNEVVGEELADGIYIIRYEDIYIRMSVADHKIIGIKYPQTTNGIYEDFSDSTGNPPITIPGMSPVFRSPEIMNRDPRKLKGDYYIYATILSGDTTSQYNEEDILFPLYGTYEVPDWNVRLSIGKNWKSRIYSSSVTSFPTGDTNSTLIWFKYVFDPTTGMHTFVPRDVENPFGAIIGYVYNRTDTVVTTSDGVVREAIILSATTDDVKLVLCRYNPAFVTPCDPRPSEIKPWNAQQFKDLIATYGPMSTWLDTVKQGMKGVYYQQPFTGRETAANHEVNISNVPYDYIFNLYNNDYGGVCGNYSNFLRRTLELYGIRAWEYSIGIPNTSTGGHMQTLVEHVRLLGDTAYYIMDADFNYFYLDSIGNPMDVRDQFAMIAVHRQQEIGMSQNFELATFFRYGPCLRTTGTGVYTPDAYVEEPGSGSLYRHHLVRRIEVLAVDPEYTDISISWENLEAQGYQYRGEFTDWPMSVIWFKGVYGTPDSQAMTVRIQGWIQEAGFNP